MEHGPDSRRCPLLHVRENVAVHLKRHRDRAVAEPLADDVDRLARLKQQGRAGVPEAVKFDPAHARLFHEAR